MATNPSFDPTLFNSGVSQAQWVAVDQQPAHAADQQGGRRALCARLDLQDGGRAGRRWRRARSRPGDRSTAPAISTSATRASIAGARAAMARSICAAALKHSCDVFSTRPPGASASTASPPCRTASAWASNSAIDLPGARAGLRADARLAHRPGQALEHRRHHRQRHRPGLHPGHAAAARHLCRAASPPAARCSRI